MNRFNWFWPEKAHRNWAKLRAKGRSHFVYVNGVLGWGGSMFAIMALGPVLSGTAVPSATYFAGAFLRWAIAGYIFGVWVWRMSEKRFQQIEGTQLGAEADGPASGGPAA